jgi:transketolase
MTHHSTQDIAAMAAIPNMRCYLPSDRFQSKALIKDLLKDSLPAYIRIGRNPVPDIYADTLPFELNHATVLQDGSDVAIIACGEVVSTAKEAGIRLGQQGVSARVLDMSCIKPIDREAVAKAARETKAIVTVEEHSPFGGLGAMVSQITAEENPVRVKTLALPDSPVITGVSKEVFAHYGLDAKGIEKAVLELIELV